MTQFIFNSIRLIPDNKNKHKIYERKSSTKKT